MSMIKHHPADDVLLKYVGGHYDTAFNLVLAAHVSVCKKCQKTVDLHQGVGGQILEAESLSSMSVSADSLLDDMAVVDEPVSEMKPGYSKSLKAGIPSILNHYLPNEFDQLKWQKLSPGIKQHIVKLDGGASARLIQIAPGKAVPPHGHSGEEMTLILSGGYYDGDEAYSQGDLHLADHEAPHEPTAMEDKPCLVLAATDSPLIFQNWIPKLLQPLFKI